MNCMKTDVDTLPKSSKDALASGSKFYFTGQPCIHGHVCMRRAINHACLDCVEIATHTDEHKRRIAEYHRNYYERPEVVERRNELHPLTLRRNRERYAENRGKPQGIMRRAKYNEYYRAHRAHITAVQKRWVKSHPDKYRATQRTAQARRRAVKMAAGGDVMEAKKFKKWVDAQPKVCFYCGVDCSSTFHVDHFVPLSKGGTHSADNLRITCRHCNLTKHASDPYQFMYKSASATLALLAILSNS